MNEKEYDFGGEIVFRWENPSSRKDRIMSNEAKEYVVVKDQKAQSGVVVFGKYNDEWHCNPWNSRPVIREMLADIENRRNYESFLQGA